MVQPPVDCQNTQNEDGVFREFAEEILRFMRYRWFSELQPAPDRFLSILLMSVYAHWKAGRPLHKKAAWQEIGVEAVKTGRKYIADAEKRSLIRLAQSSEDKRKELLIPTAELQKVVEHQLRVLSYEFDIFPLQPFAEPHQAEGNRDLLMEELLALMPSQKSKKEEAPEPIRPVLGDISLISVRRGKVYLVVDGATMRFRNMEEYRAWLDKYLARVSKPATENLMQKKKPPRLVGGS